MCSEAIGPECSDKSSIGNAGRDSGQERGPSTQHISPSRWKSRAEESGGAQPGQHQQHLSNQGQERGWGLKSSPTGKAIGTTSSTEEPEAPSAQPAQGHLGGHEVGQEVGPGQDVARMSTPHTLDKRQKLREHSSQKNDLEPE